MQKQKIIIIAGAILALMAVFMTKAYIDQERQKVFAEAKKKIAGMQANISKNQSQVLMATRDIPKGSTIAEDSVEVKVIPDQYRQPQAVTSIGRVMGMVTIASIAKGEQIILTKLVQSRQLGGLAEGTPIGKRAITISVDNLASLAGMINPGDYVDVIAMVAVPVQTAEGKQSSQIAVMPLFQNVLVLAIGQVTGVPPRGGAESSGGGGRYSAEEDKKSGIGAVPLITIALSPQEANLIAFVQEQGKIRLTLRSPADSRIEFTQPASWDTLFKYIMPQQEQISKPGAKELIKEPINIEYVEIYRGANKEKVILPK